MSSSLQDQLQLALGDMYHLERELGGGGMSRVFVAQERALGRKVVVKVLLPELAAEVNIERFRREIQLAAQLQHPHIVPLLSASEAYGLPYFIMPFVTGESLRTRITREGEFPVSDTVRILRDVVSALAYAHGFGVIHRDVKPDNVLLSHGVAVVTDFGVAKAISASAGEVAGSGITSANVALGTPAYMAPEQATASPQIDHRADIYALGVMAYELLTGSPPFAGRNAQAVLAAHVIEDPEPVERRRPATPPMLANLVRECLSKRPADRPQSANHVMHVLDAIATPSGGTAATTAVRIPAFGAPRSSRGKWVAAGGVAVVLLMVGGVLWLAPPPASDNRAVTAGASGDSVVARVPAADSVQARPAPAPPAPEPIRRTPAQPQSRRRAAAPAPPAARPTQTPEAEVPAPTPEPVRVDTPSVGGRAAEPAAAAAALPAEAGRPAVPPPAAAAGAPPPAAAAAPAVPAPPAAPRTPPPGLPAAPADQRPAIRNVVSDYATAIEAQDIEAIRRVYPGMTDPQQRGWQQFFQLTRDVKANLVLSQIQVANTTAEGLIEGSYTYLNTSNGRITTQPVTFRASFRSEGGKWRMVSVR